MLKPEPQMLVQDAPAQQEPRIYSASIFKPAIPGVTGDKLASASTNANFDGKDVTFSVPSHAALCLNISNEAFQKIQALSFDSIFKVTSYGRAAEEGLPLLFDFFELSLQNIVFAFTSLEAFANQTIPEDFIFTKLRQDKKCEESYNKDQIERQLSLDIKLSEALPAITGTPFVKGTPLWNKYADLREIRDKIIHVKSTDLGVRVAGVDSVWSKLLERRNINVAIVAHKVISHFPRGSDNSSPVASGRNQWIKAFPY